MAYFIFDADGNVTNTIIATPDFMAAHYPAGNYSPRPEPEPEPAPEVAVD